MNGTAVKWKDVKIGDKMKDGSEVTQLHPIHEIDCYTVTYGNMFSKTDMVLSADHILLCDISKIDRDLKKEVLDGLKGYKIPKKMDYKVLSNEDLTIEEQAKLAAYLTGDNTIGVQKDGEDINNDISDSTTIDEILAKCEFEEEVVESDDAIISEKQVWLSVRIIANIVKYGETVLCNGHKFYNARYTGIKEARCVSTDTGKYEAKGLTHHNSVAVRNIILHSLTHTAEMSVGLIDLKQTEFTYFKGKEGVVGVANEVQEAAELLRIARDVMYKRNKEMAAIGVTDMLDFKPKEPTEIIWVSGKELHQDEIVKVKINGEVKEMSAKELLELVNTIDN